ncbi:MAG: D-Ala-D-Ala carboxypeptidase family metallohydrolase [Endomicrobia bacterium]|nr:D-Ala-D-Ala carboxypeptidase family metallohydrolase [Endomicrobiia bacterium]
MKREIFKEKYLKEPDKPLFITRNFTIQELTKTQHRQFVEKNVLDVLNSDLIFNNLVYLCEKILQPLRDKVGAINISSGYRCPELNRLIGSTDKSQHVLGQAIDFVLVKSIPVVEQFKLVYNTIKELNISYGQIIYEYTWIHLSAPNKEKNLINQPPLQLKDNRYIPFKENI